MRTHFIIIEFFPRQERDVDEQHRRHYIPEAG